MVGHVSFFYDLLTFYFVGAAWRGRGCNDYRERYSTENWCDFKYCGKNEYGDFVITFWFLRWKFVLNFVLSYPVKRRITWL